MPVTCDKKVRPMASPFDTSPSTTSPYSMTNVQCFISGNPIYQTQQNYTFETFTNELNNFGLNDRVVSKSGEKFKRVLLWLS